MTSFLLLMFSCTGGPPYEAKSPCVSSYIENQNNIDDTYIIIPCTKRPANNFKELV
ncbi:MAG: DUF2706 domain-containing protein [Rickettsiaceae bacterium]|nr:DUF2706 domain-containing protein [Rickettsiaceae bacterium]